MKLVALLILAVLALLVINCGGRDQQSSASAELEAYFSQVQAINDEYQGRLDADDDKQHCFREFDSRGQDRNVLRSMKAEVVECITEADESFTAREDWLRQMKAVDPPDLARSAHQVLTNGGDNDNGSPLPTETVEGGIDPGILRFLEACEELVNLAADNGIRLRMWCSISSS